MEQNQSYHLFPSHKNNNIDIRTLSHVRNAYPVSKQGFSVVWYLCRHIKAVLLVYKKKTIIINITTETAYDTEKGTN